MDITLLGLYFLSALESKNNWVPNEWRQNLESLPHGWRGKTTQEDCLLIGKRLVFLPQIFLQWGNLLLTPSKAQSSLHNQRLPTNSCMLVNITVNIIQWRLFSKNEPVKWTCISSRSWHYSWFANNNPSVRRLISLFTVSFTLVAQWLAADFVVFDPLQAYWSLPHQRSCRADWPAWSSTSLRFRYSTSSL